MNRRGRAKIWSDLEDARGPWHGQRFDAMFQLSTMALRDSRKFEQALDRCAFDAFVELIRKLCAI